MLRLPKGRDEVVRPRVPLISRRKALIAALAIIDAEGLEAFSIRRLAEELGVNGTSLYHHFANKEEILVGAAELALADVRTPDTTEQTWQTWLPENTRMLRKAMVAHPALVPIIVRKGQLGMGAQMLESSAARFVEEGVPIGAIMPLLDAAELFAIGSAIHQTRGEESHPEPTAGRPPPAMIQRANAERSLSADELFEVVTAAILQAVKEAAEAKLVR
jgi:TetR/AcrR family transcriptional regulator, tetracycline repressor protein